MDQDIFFKFRHDDFDEIQYACLLIPHLNSRKLTEDLAECLPNWMRKICETHEWQLDYIEAQENYLHWVIATKISTTPAQFMKIINAETSELIISNFGQIASEGVAEKFWAPGYLVLVGGQPIHIEVIKQYAGMIYRRLRI